MDSDVDVSGWVIELLLRDREKECIAKRVLAVAPFSDQDYRLKKTVLLRTIECEVCEASVSETILETLEMIEDMDISQGMATADSMKAAYLAVATECTVKFLVGSMGKPSGKYLDAVDRIWRGRVGVLERSETSLLVTAELRQRMDEVEAGVWDLKVSKKLSRMNTRNDALRLVSVYVKEALTLLGPPFITWAIRLNVPKDVADLEGDRIVVAKNGANVGGGSEVAKQTANGSELEAQMANYGQEVEEQPEVGANAGEGSELEVQMANGVNVGGGSMAAGMANEDNVGGLQMANGRNEGDDTRVDEQMVDGTNVGYGSELEEQIASWINAGDEPELEAQMVNRDNVVDEAESEAQNAKGSILGDESRVESPKTVNRTNERDEPQCPARTTDGINEDGESALEKQPVKGADIGEGSELEVQMANGVSVGGGSLDAEMANEDNVGGLQMANGRNVSNDSGLDEQMVDGTNVGYGSALEEQTTNWTNDGDEPELEAQLASRDYVVDESESKGQNAEVGSILGAESRVESSKTVNGTSERDEPQCQAQTTAGFNVGGESTTLESQPMNGAENGGGLDRQMANGNNGSYEPALPAPQPTSGMQLQDVGVGNLQPTVSWGSGSNDIVETDSGFTHREVRKLSDDQVRGEVNERVVALPSTNGEQGLSFDPTTKDREIQRNTGVRHKRLAHRRTRGPVKIRDAEDFVTDSSNRDSDSLSTPEVTIAQEALKSSMLELQSVVTDPLPAALRVSETIRSDLVIKSVNLVNEKDVVAENPSFQKDALPAQSNTETLGNLSSSHHNDVPESSRTEKNVPNSPVDQRNGTEAVQTNCANLGNLSFGNQTNVRPSLMERSTTARTYEWDDSIDMSQEDRMNHTSRLHLPSPKRHAVSPLKKFESKRSTKRRKVKRWSLAEEEALRDAVKKYGRGNWKLILDAYRDMFVERTEVDLKDKWRNMTRYACE